MLRVLFVCLLLLHSEIFSNDFDWADYEKLCWKADRDPSYEEYEWLCENLNNFQEM